ncbi:hypothetical protein VTN00DRAFT_4498 [Thermoascus crustaceus]|uniref:uncharacterized protein n=1 Tax=Thermoascus crustaceus TaxID=5088 RepID=UPI003743FD8C
MSAESQPITPAAFAEAIKSLPLSAVYAKVSELRNSIAHLHRSNAELRLFIAENEADEATASEAEKRELEGYIAENEGVIAAMTERIALLRTEIEVNRGQTWVELDPEAAADAAEEARAEALEGTTTATTTTAEEMTPAPTVNGASSTRATVGGTPDSAATMVNGTSEASSQAAAHTTDRDRQQHADVDMEEEEGIHL